jgi:hypothetical protein
MVNLYNVIGGLPTFVRLGGETPFGLRPRGIYCKAGPAVWIATVQYRTFFSMLRSGVTKNALIRQPIPEQFTSAMR